MSFATRLIDLIAAGDERADLLKLAHAYRELAEVRRDEVIRLQAELDAQLASQRMAYELVHARNVRDLLENFLVCLDHPEVDMRDPILQGISDIQDDIARLEEHSPT